MLGFALALLTLLTARGRFDDPDTWWHLKVGEIICQTRALPRADLLSYTTNHHSWIPHEWLAEVSIYTTYKLGGYRGMFLWLFLCGSLVFLLLYVLCSLYSGNAKVALVGALIGWLFGTVSLAIRPLLLGNLFLVAELLFLHLGRVRDRRWLWALPPLFALWVNCHASWPFGIIVLGIAALCSFVNLHAGELVSAAWEPQTRRLLCSVVALCVAALFVNPVGPRLVFYPFDVLTRQAANLANVTEWRALDVSDLRGQGLFLLAGAIGLLFLARPRAVRLEELMLLGLGAAMALRHVRMVFVFGIVAAPIVCKLLADAWDSYEPEHDHRIANAVLIFTSIAIMIAAFPSRDRLEQQVQKDSPAGAVDFIRRSGLPGPMLNEYVWGGYLIWALPEQKVFIDGRTDIFDWTGVLSQYGRWVTLEEDPRPLLDKYGIRYILLQKSAPIAFLLPYLSGWKKVYADDVAVIFSRQ